MKREIIKRKLLTLQREAGELSFNMLVGFSAQGASDEMEPPIVTGMVANVEQSMQLSSLMLARNIELLHRMNDVHRLLRA